MKKVAIVSLMVLGLAFVAFLPVGTAQAQYLPTTGQPFQFAPVYNPALTAMDPYGDIRLGYRSQLGAFGANSPSFFNALYQFRLTQPADPHLNGFRTGASNDSQDSPRRMGMVHGMGINIFDEQLGMISRKGGGVSYSFHFPVSEKLMLAVGTSLMVENLRIDADKIYLGAAADTDPIYESILAGKTNNNQLNVRAGAVLYSRMFYVGLSYLPVWKYDLTDGGWLTASSINKATLQTGVSFDISETVVLKPSIVGVLSQDNHLNLDYGVKVFVRNMVWAGAMWRDTQTGVAQLGYNINKMFSAAYSYEISTGEWKFGAGSHELVLGIRLNNFRNQPSYIW
ncbi:MAG TPA: PorP/SprF family type IX secretion system membrane protein [Cyclobacteriaceae bacterium]|nr:PorP/SprF family type IX secretion system membrane protein [Cyclobacteriaceae bacterium]